MSPQPSTLNSQPSLALIGCGYWGKNLARNFHALGALHTLCDQSQAILAGYGEDYAGVRKTSDLAEVLRDTAVTRVAIAAPAALHHALARQALLAGKDVFVEKPLCLEAREAEDLLELARQQGRILMVGHLLQYHPCIQKIQSLVAAGELGKLYYITSNRLNLGKIRREENALWSFAPHDLSVILSLAGHQPPQQVRCTGQAYLNHEVPDTTLTTLRFAGGLRAHIYVSWLNPFKEQKLTVVGSHGMVVFDDTRPWNEKLILHRNYLTWADGQTPTPNKAKGEPVVVPEAEPLREECRHFLDCCQERRTPRTDAAEGLRVLRVLQAAQRSLEADGEAVGVEDGRAKMEVGRLTPEAHLRSPISHLPSPDFFAHPTAVVDDGAVIGKGTKVWHFSHIMKGAKIGERCVFGQNVNVDGGTVIGNNVKVQNNVAIYTGSVIEDDVFLGPSCVLTNVTNPRSQVNRHSLYEKTLIKRGATVGANATIVCGVTLGRYCFVGAGAVVTRDVPDYALVLGNPARQHGWMSRHGHRLKPAGDDGVMVCPESGFRYRLVRCEQMEDGRLKAEDRGKETGGSRQMAEDGRSRTVSQSPTSNPQPSTLNSQPREFLRCLDLDEEAPLPAQFNEGNKSYDEFKHG